MDVLLIGLWLIKSINRTLVGESINSIDENVSGEIWAIIAVEGPNGDCNVGNKRNFLKKINNIIEESEGKAYALGDFNSRVEARDSKYIDAFGNDGKNIRNDNRKRLLDYCMMSSLVVLRKFCNQKDNTQVYKRTSEQRGNIRI